ncbi:hypothetical protein CDAR_39261 [Caerostris darwini]|uniref:Uncharacterized protein n=1 Tax=Caerostris darwini TaxID=1538125 RepID=A0AAV4SZA3_9ARAC|nr:hypothetical protein CDAR_39261 [Caerostris darwini]
METLPCSEFFAGSNFFKVMWNFPKYLYPCLLCCNLLFQIMWLFFVSNYKDDWAVLIVLFLQLWNYICVFRSRASIQLLTEDLYRISNMLRVYTIQKKKMLRIYIWLYCLFVISLTVVFEVTLFNSGMIVQYKYKLRNSELIPAHLKELTVAILKLFFSLP